jgi:hypothetical protein
MVTASFGRIVGNPSRAGTQGSGLDSDFVVYRRSNSLRAAKVSLSRLHRDMPKEELDLLQFAASGATESGAASAQIEHPECFWRRGPIAVLGARL